MKNFKYHKLVNHDDKLVKTKISTNNLIKAHVLGENNNCTGEIIEIDLEDLISPDCAGGCGVSRAVCYLDQNNCINWQCMNNNCRDFLVYIRRGKYLVGQPVCQVCGSFLVESQS